MKKKKKDAKIYNRPSRPKNFHCISIFDLLECSIFVYDNLCNGPILVWPCVTVWRSQLGCAQRKKGWKNFKSK